MALINAGTYCLLAGCTGPEIAQGPGYAALPTALVAVERSVAQHDPAEAQALNRYLCRSLLGAFSPQQSPWVVPDTLGPLYQQQVERIEQVLMEKPDSYFDLSLDPFRKDIAFLKHRLIPCGAEFVTPYSGISRRLIFRGGWRQAVKFTSVTFRCHGFKPFLELHMHPHVTENFNPQGWIETYEMLAELLTANPSFLGVQSTSWFLDPAMQEVSPHLVYLREVPERCGAAILYAGEDDRIESGAFATSRSRQRLCLQGRYSPRLYTRIWPRRALLQRRWRS